VEIKIIKENRNPLIKRREIVFSVKHENAATPTRAELRKELATKLKSTPEQTFVIKVETKTGSTEAIGEAQVYDSAEIAKSIIPEYILIRSLPPEERKKLAEERRAKAVAKKPEEKKPAEKKPEAEKRAPEPKKPEEEKPKPPKTEPPKA